MEIKIGVQHSPREVALDSELSPEEVQAAVTKAIDSGSLLPPGCSTPKVQ